MSEIYALTSPHLYGIISRILPDETSASNVLKSVYKRIWETRHAALTVDPLLRMRALAHRYAVDYKLTNTVIGMAGTMPSPDPNIKTSNVKTAGLSDTDLQVMALAYLSGSSLEDLALHENCTVEDMRKKFSTILSKMMEDPS